MIEALGKAWQLLWGLDPDLLECVRVSLACSVSATAAATVAGTPLALLLGRKRFPGRRGLLVLARTGMATPTVLIGLLCYALMSRTGPLGRLGLLYTPQAIALAEFALALPIVVALLSAVVATLEPRLEMTARTLGAGRLRTQWTVVREAKAGLVGVTMSAFGRVCSELGIAMMVGGNIRHYTRTMTTAIALETAGGEFSLALALGMILLAIALAVNVLAQLVRLPKEKRSADVL